jgi:hypothetical protein
MGWLLLGVELSAGCLLVCIATISHPSKLLVVCELITTQGKL